MGSMSTVSNLYTMTRLREVRTSKGWTQAKLARAVDVSEQTVRNAEKGRVRTTHYVAARMARALRVPIKALGDRTYL